MTKQSPAEKQQNDMAISQAVILSKVGYIEQEVRGINAKLDAEYATKEWVDAQYGQSKKLINGIAGIILTAVILALVGLVVLK